MKKLLLSVMILLPMTVWSQTIEENPEIRGYLDNLFAPLAKGRIPTGYLIDYAVDIIDFNDYNGTVLTDSNYVNPEVFEYMLRGIRSASVIEIGDNISVSFEYCPTAKELLSKLLENTAFRDALKQVKPYGSLGYQMIPFVCRKIDSDRVYSLLMSVVYVSDM